MKINFGNERFGTPIKNISVGETFLRRESLQKKKEVFI